MSRCIDNKNLEILVQQCLDEFYRRRIEKLDGLKLKDALKRKNPYLFRAIGMAEASEIVEQLLAAYMSSSDEGIFGDAFFEPVAKHVSAGKVSPSEGVDIAIETSASYTAIAVKSGPSVFNAQSKRRQNDEFMAVRSRLLKLHKRFEAVVGYCYGCKVSRTSSSRIFIELAGQTFWQKLTGDSEFYLRLMAAMKDAPLRHKAKFQESWSNAVNRFTRDFTCEFCCPDGAIDWEKLVTFNSGCKDS